jgi:hypothetical protein
MINSKEDYLYYLKRDRIALGKANASCPKIIHDEIEKFERFLRKKNIIITVGKILGVSYMVHIFK